MAKSRNNEAVVSELVKNTILPSMFVVNMGDSVANVPDLIILDNDDPELNTRHTAIKAHYIVSDTKLFLHSPDEDPWNLIEVIKGLGFEPKFIEDTEVSISKRSSAAARKTTKEKEALGRREHRNTAIAIRFWVEYPESYIDLADEDHRDAVYNMLFNIRSRDGFVPHVTIDAKLNNGAQYTGPTVTINRDASRQLDITTTGDAIDDNFFVDTLKLDYPDAIDAIHNWMDALGINTSRIKIVGDESLIVGPNIVKESVFNANPLYLVLDNIKLNLASNTLKKPVTFEKGLRYGISEEETRAKKARQKEAQEESAQQKEETIS